MLPYSGSVFVDDGIVFYSASDLAAAARCEYALLRSFDAHLGWGPPVAVEDELLARTAKLGGEHEHRHLDELRSRADESVVVIGRPRYTVAGLTAAAEQTMRAVERRAPVIYQAAMFDGRFVGFADFLLFDGEEYRLRDTKLARSVKVESLLQLAAYADVLAAAGVPVSPEVELVLGDGATARYPVGELLPVYRRRRAALERLLDGHFAGGAAVGWEDERRTGVLPLPGMHHSNPRPRRPVAGRQHEGEPARPVDRSRYHHDDRPGEPRRSGARNAGAEHRSPDRASATADRTASRRPAALRDSGPAAAVPAARS